MGDGGGDDIYIIYSREYFEKEYSLAEKDMSLDTHTLGRETLDLTPDPNAWLFNCYLLGLKSRNPWFLVAARHFNRVALTSHGRGLRDFEFDRLWHETEAVYRYRRRIAFDDDTTFDSVFPYRQLLEEATSFVSLTADELGAVLAGKPRESLELRFEHFSEHLKGYSGATFDELLVAMDSHWNSEIPSRPENSVKIIVKQK